VAAAVIGFALLAFLGAEKVERIVAARRASARPAPVARR